MTHLVITSPLALANGTQLIDSLHRLLPHSAVDHRDFRRAYTLYNCITATESAVARNEFYAAAPRQFRKIINSLVLVSLNTLTLHMLPREYVTQSIAR